jgi:protein-disulfide isomerase
MADLGPEGQENIAKLSLPVSSKRDHIQGKSYSSITLVEYGDYECPYCGQAYPVIKEIQKRLKNRCALCFVISHLHKYTLMHNRQLKQLEYKKSFGMLEYSYHQSYIIPVSITPFVITIIFLP